jgi:hypothetical protein
MITANWTDPQGKLHQLQNLASTTIPGFVTGESDGRTFTVNRTELKDVKRIPSHLQEGVFRKYEPIIARLVKNPGRSLSIPSTPDLSPRTIAARLRDAIASHVTYQWKSEVNPAALAGMRKDFCVRQYIDSVEIVFNTKDTPFTVTETTNEVVLSGLTLEPVDLHSLARLLSKRILQGPYRITNPDPATILEIERLYDIGVVKNPDTSVILV